MNKKSGESEEMVSCAECGRAGKFISNIMIFRRQVLSGGCAHRTPIGAKPGSICEAAVICSPFQPSDLNFINF